MRMNAALIVLLFAPTLVACASKGAPPPIITYDSGDFKPATVQVDPPPPAVPAIPAGTVIGPTAPPAELKAPDEGTPTARVQQANSQALREPTREGYINAAQVYPYSESALYRLYTAPQQVSDIALQPGETLSAISAGDTVRWAVGDTTSGNGTAKQVHVLVKPFAPALNTNLVIMTDKRSYHLVLQSTQHVSMAAVSWTYASDGLVTDKREAASAAPIDTGLALDSIAFRYEITGDQAPWRPIRAFDDGHKVYIEFPGRLDQGEAPPLFVVGQDGGTELVNYRVRGNYYVVDRLFAAAELRLGQDKQQVVRISRTDGKPARKGPLG